MMATQFTGQKFSGAARTWEDFAAAFDESGDDSLFLDEDTVEEFRDEYVRLPHDDVPVAQECRW